MKTTNQFNKSSKPLIFSIGPIVMMACAAVHADDDSINLIWEANADAVDGYNIYQAVVPSASFTLVGTTDKTNITIRGLKEGNEYMYYATAFDARGESDPSDSVSWNYGIFPHVMVGTAAAETMTSKYTLTSMFLQSGDDTALPGPTTTTLNVYGQGGRDFTDLSGSTNLVTTKVNGGAHNDRTIFGRGTTTGIGEDGVDKFEFGWQAFLYGKNFISDFNLTDVPDYMEKDPVLKTRRGDVLVIRSIEGFNAASSDITKFVRITPGIESPNDLYVRVDSDGPGPAPMIPLVRLTDFVSRTGMTNLTGQPITVPYLYTNGNLIIENSPRPAPAPAP